MRTDTEIRSLGFQVLFKYMDIIEAEKFISIINREKFDYTEWRQTLFEDMTIEDIIKDAKKFAIDFRRIKRNIRSMRQIQNNRVTPSY